MMHLGQVSKIGNYKFEILSATNGDPGLLPPDTDAKGHLYVSIRGSEGLHLASTILTHRFQTEQEATAFCQDVANGKYPIKTLMTEEQHAFEHWLSVRDQIGKTHFEAFLAHVQTMGVSPDTLKTIFGLYDKLPAEARKMIRDEQAVSQFQAKHPMPAKEDKITFGAWMKASKRDVDVCLVDSDTGEHYLDAVVYLTDRDQKDPDLQYSPLENWLFTLPVERVVNEGYNADLVIVNTDFTMAQTDFLLGHSEDGFDSQEWANLYDRAHYADAEFEARLAFLTNGTPFEVPFDGNCMDAASISDRKELCAFLESHDKLYVVPAKNDLLVVYSLSQKPSGGISAEDCLVCVKETEPGKGIASTLEGKIACAKSQANSGQDSLKQPDHENERIS